MREISIKFPLWAIVFATALLLRLLFVFALTPRPLVGDSPEYDSIAVNLALHDEYSVQPGVPTACRAPGYPFFLAGIYKASGGDHQAARAVQALLGALTCLFVFLIFKPFSGVRAALLGGLLCAAHPVLIAFTGQILSETLFIFLFTGSLLFFLRWYDGGGALPLGAAAVFFALGTMTRPMLILMPVFFFGTAAVLRREWRRPLTGAIVFVALLAVLVAPWAARNNARFGKPTLFTSGHGPLFVLTLLKGGPTRANVDAADAMIAGAKDEYERDAILKKELDRMVREEPVRTFFSLLSSMHFIPRFWLTSHSSIFGIDRPNSEYVAERNWGLLAIKTLLLLLNTGLLIAAVAGLWGMRADRAHAVLLALVAVYFTLHFNNVPRYHLPAVPCLMGLAGVWLARRFPGSSGA